MTFFDYGGIRLMITTRERTDLDHPCSTFISKSGRSI